MNNGIDSISDLTERLLHLSRLQFGDQAELEFSMVDVETLLKEIASQQGIITPDRTITLDITEQPQLPLIAADEMLYRQALTNLVNNALKYTPEGDEIVVRAFQLDDEEHPQIRVSVIDHGIGIREEDQKRLFEAFFRVPQREGEPPRPRGNGLGLALVKAIAHSARRHSRRSDHREGSTFHTDTANPRPQLSINPHPEVLSPHFVTISANFKCDKTDTTVRYNLTDRIIIGVFL